MKYILTAFAIATSALTTAHAGVWNTSTYTYDPRIVPFTTFNQERLSAQKHLPCKWVTMPQNPTAGYDFLCKGGTWATISYMLDKSPYDPNALGRARLIWRSWHPDAHPSGGEAHTVQPFLNHMLTSLVPARFASDVEYAFWQGKNQAWHARDVAVLYSHEMRADHALHKLEIIGRAPKLGMLAQKMNLQPMPQPVPAHALPIQHPQTWTTPAPQERLTPDVMLQAPTPMPTQPPMLAPSSIAKPSPYSATPVAPNRGELSRGELSRGDLSRGGPAFLQEEEPLMPQNMLEEVSVQPESLEEMATKSIEAQPANPTLAPTKGASAGSVAPAYQPWPAQKTQSVGNAIPTLEKSSLELNLGTAVNIPAPPSVLMPYGRDSLKNTTVLKEAEALVPSDDADKVIPIKERLLKEYYEAETTTERYRNRAEGKINEPLREKLIQE